MDCGTEIYFIIMSGSLLFNDCLVHQSLGEVVCDHPCPDFLLHIFGLIRMKIAEPDSVFQPAEGCFYSFYELSYNRFWTKSLWDGWLYVLAFQFHFLIIKSSRLAFIFRVLLNHHKKTYTMKGSCCFMHILAQITISNNLFFMLRAPPALWMFLNFDIYKEKERFLCTIMKNIC